LPKGIESKFVVSVAEIQSVLWHLQESMAALQMMEIGFIVMSVMYGRMGATIIYISALRKGDTD
jgi:hypothetical protein